MVTRSRGGRGEALSSAVSASPRDQLVDAKPKAWHDGAGQQRLPPEPVNCGTDPAVTGCVVYRAHDAPSFC
jgi:hypothetical protein